MSRHVFGIYGAEPGHTYMEATTPTGTGQSYDTGVVRSGLRSYKFSAAAACYYSVIWGPGAVGRTMYHAAWFYIPASPGLPTTATTIIFQARLSTAVVLCSVAITPTGTLVLLNQAGVQIGAASAAVSLDAWHRIELGLTINTGATDYAELRVDGVTVASTSTGAFSDTAPGAIAWGWVGTPTASRIIYFDDITINDSQGTVNNTWVGNEKTIQLLPVSDVAIGGWTAGGGATTNLFEGVNNIPPIGVASPGTNASQVGNPVSSTTDNYDMAMQTYAAAGITAADTITAVQGWVSGSNSSTVGSDTLRIEGVSNPAIVSGTANIDLLAATWPSGWGATLSAVAEMPTVNVNTPHVFRVGKNIANTRRANVCSVTTMVCYVPAPPAVPVRRQQTMIS